MVSSLNGITQQKLQEINPLLHDEGYTTVFGVLPDANTNDHERIQTHLAFAEHLLRSADVKNLSASQQASRNFVLDLLHQYWTAGVFPKNRNYSGEI